MPSEEEISQAVHEILRTHDLQSITLRIVMNMLCERFSLPKEHLNQQKQFVRDIINDFLQNSYEPDVAAPDASGAASSGSPHGAEPDEDEPNDQPDATNKRKRATPAKKKAPRPRTSASGRKEVRLTGLEKAVVLAEPLVEFFGDKVLARSQIPKRISTYAKLHSLQDPNDGRRIISDESLKKALSVDEFTFFTLPKLISGLVYKPEDCSEELQAIAQECEAKLIEEKTKRVEAAAEAAAEAEAAGVTTPTPKRPRKKQKAAANDDDPDAKPRKPNGLAKPMQLSEALVAVVGETQLPRSEVLKKLWGYIRENNLKDPDNAMQVICDDKLKAVFHGNTVGNMAILKHLSAHMTKIEET